jgi:hypothetical protein
MTQVLVLGHWEETIAPSVIQDIDATTMPHVIIREANGTFTYRQLSLAAATGSAGPSTVAGIVTAVILSGVTSAGHVVGEQFAARGGTGNNLRLRVDEAYNSDKYLPVLTAANSGTYVRQD